MTGNSDPTQATPGAGESGGGAYPNPHKGKTEGTGGFSVDVFRDFKRPGSEKVLRTEKFHTDYVPADTVRCEPPG